jgi:hypothetical protein
MPGGMFTLRKLTFVQSLSFSVHSGDGYLFPLFALTASLYIKSEKKYILEEF